MNVSLSIVIALIGGCLAIVGSLITLNLRSIKSCLRNFSERINKQDTQIEKSQADVKGFGENIRNCKIDCSRNMVSKEDWVRSEGYTRRELKELSSTLNRIEGKFAIVEKVPEICGNVVHAVMKELNSGGHANGT